MPEILYKVLSNGSDALLSGNSGGGGGGSVPVGSIIATLALTPPQGWLLCNGTEVSQTDYSDLYNVIGSRYGSASSGKFRLPDFTNRVMWGVQSSSSSTLSAEGSGKISAKLPNISGSFYALDQVQQYEGAFSNGGAKTAGNYGEQGEYSYQKQVFSATKSNSIYKDGATVTPPAIACNIIIKA